MRVQFYTDPNKLTSIVVPNFGSSDPIYGENENSLSNNNVTKQKTLGQPGNP
jgi:hypothetical protein